MTEKDDLIEKIVLGEIEGKNRAIHAYDGIVWKIHSGFLILLFGGWSILLTGIVQITTARPPTTNPTHGDCSTSASDSRSARGMSTAATSGASSGWSMRSIGSLGRSHPARATVENYLRSRSGSPAAQRCNYECDA